MDKDLLLCVFIFFAILFIWIWIKEDFLKELAVGFGGAVMMGLKVGMRSPDQASSTSSASITTTKE